MKHRGGIDPGLGVARLFKATTGHRHDARFLVGQIGKMGRTNRTV